MIFICLTHTITCRCVLASAYPTMCHTADVFAMLFHVHCRTFQTPSAFAKRWLNNSRSMARWSTFSNCHHTFTLTLYTDTFSPFAFTRYVMHTSFCIWSKHWNNNKCAEKKKKSWIMPMSDDFDWRGTEDAFLNHTHRLVKLYDT